ncbi:MAG: hypothetical protein R2728_10840 [Chitinophagales bacterium]
MLPIVILIEKGIVVGSEGSTQEENAKTAFSLVESLIKVLNS